MTVVPEKVIISKVSRNLKEFMHSGPQDCRDYSSLHEEEHQSRNEAVNTYWSLILQVPPL